MSGHIVAFEYGGIGGVAHCTRCGTKKPIGRGWSAAAIFREFDGESCIPAAPQAAQSHASCCSEVKWLRREVSTALDIAEFANDIAKGLKKQRDATASDLADARALNGEAVAALKLALAEHGTSVLFGTQALRAMESVIAKAEGRS